MRPSFRLSWIFWLALPALLVACSNLQATSPTPTVFDPNPVYTAAVLTADARMKEELQRTPSATPVPPTQTPDFTQTAAIGAAATQSAQQTLIATLTPAATATATILPTSPAGADNAAFTLVENPKDGAVFAPGAAFTKMWQFKNTGSTTWDERYSFVYISGDLMGQNVSVKIPTQVAPNQTVDINVSLTAPAKAGSYKSYWRMINPAGQFFGESVYVLITVSGDGAVASATPGSSSGAVSNVTLSVDNANVSGTCPHTFTFTAGFKLSAGATVTYQLEGGGFDNLTLPAAQTQEYGAGEYQLTFFLDIQATGTGWARLHITAPNDVTSNQVSFSMTCQ